jgi:hypothetical protein
MTRRLFSLCALVAAGVLASAEASAFKASNDAPAAWRDYSALVKSRVQDWLSGEDEAARRLRASLDGRGQQSGATTRFIARLWFLADGEVARAEFAGVDAAAVVELRALLLHRRIGAPPPADMLQPLHLQLSLQIENRASTDAGRG